MQAILLSEVEGLGEAGSVVNVARGYMRNYLLPRGLAEDGHAGAHRRDPAPRGAAQGRRGAGGGAVAGSWPTCSGRTILTLKAKAGDDGRLFGSITVGGRGDRHRGGPRRSHRPAQHHVEPPIRAVGTYSVPMELAPGLTTEVKTIVSPLID